MKRGGPIRRSTPLPRGKPPRRTGRPKAVSAKRAEENEERRDVRMLVAARSGGWCEACPILRPGLEPRPASDLHEILTRARGGSIVDPTNLLHVDRLCHDWITERPHLAAELGLVRWSWEGPPA